MTPDILFHIEDGAALTPADDLWRRPLPVDRAAGASDAAAPAGPATGDYFSAVAAFLSEDRCRRLTEMLPRDADGRPAAPDTVHIRLVKHGAFYHPARVEIRAGGRRFIRVVNVAVSAQGKAAVAEEVAAMRRLNAGGDGILPAVYGMAEAIGPHHMAMFAADWLEGFSEWHLTGPDADGVCRLGVVWNAERGHRSLSGRQLRDLLRRTAAILTGYYDVATADHIAHWHHGAGDFIVCAADDAPVDVRLITVRRYGPMVAGGLDGPEDMIEALALFLVALTMKNRVDRCDGVGDIVLADDAAVAATLEGCFDGLSRQAAEGALPPAFPGGFLSYLKSFDQEHLGQLMTALAARLPAGSEERACWKRHGGAHIRALRAAVPRIEVKIA